MSLIVPVRNFCLLPVNKSYVQSHMVNWSHRHASSPGLGDSQSPARSATPGRSSPGEALLADKRKIAKRRAL